MQWPLQSNADEFYGNPRNPVNPTVVDPRWLVNNIGWCEPPFQMTYDNSPVKRFQCHMKVRASLDAIFAELWDKSGQSPAVLKSWGVTVFGGCFNYRLKRGAKTLSMHAYGAAIDLDPAHNAFHSESFRFTPDGPVVQAFKAAGWTWGGDWRQPDAMHFQAASV